jgi:anti-anti-sigma regulatory factor
MAGGLPCTKRGNDTAWTFIMTCRINRRTIGEDRVLLRVSGWLTGENVDTLRRLMEQEKSSALILDLRDVRLADNDAVKLLAIHESKGARIDNCPLYIRERIRRQRGAT